MPFEQPKDRILLPQKQKKTTHYILLQLKIDKLQMGQFFFAYIAVWPLSLSTADKII